MILNRWYVTRNDTDITIHYDDYIQFYSFDVLLYEEELGEFYFEHKIFDYRHDLHRLYQEHRFRLFLNSLFNIYSAVRTRRMLIAKSGFLAQKGKRRKGKL